MTSENKQSSISLPTVCVTVGTAGHIDHGKTQLVKFLTGCNTDRLPEEIRRGMTIELGFAPCQLPNGSRVGIVDVPGHEKFIHNMVAGATGIDIALLVVAADDGIMQQTVEHFHILRLLGVKHGMVAVTKTDLCEMARVQEVIAGVKAMVKDSFLDGAPVCPLSTKTGDGFSEFYDAFSALVNLTAQRDASGPFRLHIERTFALKGIGTIASGIPRSGKIGVGETLELLPSGEKTRVRGLQVFGKTSQTGLAGECIALNLTDLSADEAKRGMVLCTAGYYGSSKLINARIHILPGVEKHLKPRTGIRLHIGTIDIPGHIVFPESEPIAAGIDLYVQIQAREPVVCAAGDFFVLRSLSPNITIGGGNVISLDTKKIRRSKDTWTEARIEEEILQQDTHKLIEHILEESGAEPMQSEQICQKAMVNIETGIKILEELTKSGTVILLPTKHYTHPTHLKKCEDELIDILSKMHTAQPLAMGFPKKELYRDLKSNRSISDKLLESLCASGRIKLNAIGYFIPEKAPKLNADQAAIAIKIIEIYKKNALASPKLEELPEMLGRNMRDISQVMNHLNQIGDLFNLPEKIVLHKDVLASTKKKLLDYLAINNAIEPAVFKDLIGTSRKYAIPILEYFDSIGVTKRVGNARLMKK